MPQKRSTTSRKTWKGLEWRVAKKFGTERTPLSGSLSKHTRSDTLHDKLFIEIKLRSKIPFLKTFKETLKNAEREDKLPLVVMHEKGKHLDIVMIKLEDFLEIWRKMRNLSLLSVSAGKR